MERKKLAQEAMQAEKQRLKLEKDKFRAEKMAKLKLQLDAATSFESNLVSLKAEQEAVEEAARQVADQRAGEVGACTILEAETIVALCSILAQECLDDEQHLWRLKESMRAEEEREEREAEERLHAEREKTRHLAKLRKEERRKAREVAAAEESKLKAAALAQSEQSDADTDHVNSLSLSSSQAQEEELQLKQQQDHEHSNDVSANEKVVECSAEELELLMKREAKAEAARQRKLARKMSRLSQSQLHTASHTESQTKSPTETQTELHKESQPWTEPQSQEEVQPASLSNSSSHLKVTQQTQSESLPLNLDSDSEKDLVISVFQKISMDEEVEVITVIDQQHKSEDDFSSDEELSVLGCHSRDSNANSPIDRNIIVGIDFSTSAQNCQ